MQKVVGSLIVSIKLSEQTAAVSLSTKLNQSNLKPAGSLSRNINNSKQTTAQQENPSFGQVRNKANVTTYYEISHHRHQTDRLPLPCWSCPASRGGYIFCLKRAIYKRIIYCETKICDEG